MLYGHGDDSFQYNIKFRANFSSNVWPYGTPPSLLHYLSQQIKQIDHYPSPNGDELAEDLAHFHRINKNEVLVTNGATEAFYLLAQLFKTKTATIFTPTFAEYEDACMCHQIQCTFKTFDQLNENIHTDLVFLCRPNNPTGQIINQNNLLKCFNENPKTHFIIDESYLDFVPDLKSIDSYLTDNKNLILIKSLTKTFTIPGLRLGYLLADSTLVEKIKQLKMPWSTNTLALLGGRYIIKKYGDIKPDFQQLQKESNDLQQQISNLGYQVISSPCNFFLIKLKREESTEIKSFLANKHQLLIRDASNFRNLNKHYIRIATQSIEKNHWLLKALKEWKTLH